LELGRGLLKVEEGFYPLEQLQECSEVFIASSVREIVPVREWDSHKYALPGPMTEKLKRALKNEIKLYTESHCKY
jgi:branched-subunit amino acid aminotransferase/4-amino-4-deoxychorismate lyase